MVGSQLSYICRVELINLHVTTRIKGLKDEIFQIRRLSNNLRDEIIFRLLSEYLWDETGFLS